MGILEYQAMPSLHDVALGILEYQAMPSLRDVALGELLSGQPVQYGKGRRYGPSITYKITPTGSLSSR